MTSIQTSSQKILGAILQHFNECPHSLAKKLNVSYNKVYDIYSGRVKGISSDLEYRLVNIMHVNVDFIRTGEGDIMDISGELDLISHSSDVTDSFVNLIKKLNNEKKTLIKKISFLEEVLRKNGIDPYKEQE